MVRAENAAWPHPERHQRSRLCAFITEQRAARCPLPCPPLKSTACMMPQSCAAIFENPHEMGHGNWRRAESRAKKKSIPDRVCNHLNGLGDTMLSSVPHVCYRRHHTGVDSRKTTMNHAFVRTHCLFRAFSWHAASLKIATMWRRARARARAG